MEEKDYAIITECHYQIGCGDGITHFNQLDKTITQRQLSVVLRDTRLVNYVQYMPRTVALYKKEIFSLVRETYDHERACSILQTLKNVDYYGIGEAFNG